MQVEVQLHATLTTFLPPGSRDGIARVELGEGATVGDLIRHLAIPAELSRIVLVNGHDVEDEAALHAGDVVDVFPPLAGGSEGGWYTPKAFWKRLGTRWASRTSNPVSGSRQVGGGFDSHTLPPRPRGMHGEA